MIRLGACTGAENAPLLAEIGFDYIELNLTKVEEYTEAEFDELAAWMDTLPIKAEAYNGMLPGTLKITGPEVNAAQIHAYLEKAFRRAARLGGQIIVFGSSKARYIPEGYPIDQGWRQIDNFLRLAQRHAAENNLTIAIEPLRKQESNVINYVSEAVLLASLRQLPNIRALGDTYHMAMGAEPLSALTLAGPMLAHVHTANAIGRTYPARGDGEDYKAIFNALLAGRYDGRVSIEAGCKDFETEAKEAYLTLLEARTAAMKEQKIY